MRENSDDAGRVLAIMETNGATDPKTRRDGS